MKDIYDYPVATQYVSGEGAAGEVPRPVFVYLNGDFARSRGFEFEVEKRRSRWWAGKLVYTYSQTKGKSSDPTAQKVVQETGGNAAEIRLSEMFVSWNRPHKLVMNFDLRFDKDAPWPWLEHSGLNLYVQGYSGRAYTPSNPLSGQAGEPYSKNSLFQVTTDMRLDRTVQMFSRRLDLSISAINLFGNRIINRIDPVTGQEPRWGVGSYDPNVFPTLKNPVTAENVWESAIANPSNRGPLAQWRFTLDYDF